MSDNTLNGLMKTMTRAARKDFERDGEHGPIKVIIVDDLGHRYLYWLALDSENASKVLRKALKSAHAVAYAMSMETWYTVRTPETYSKNEPPSEAPDRKEALFIFGEDKSGNQMAMKIDIKRDGDRVSLGPSTDTENHGDFSGRFTDMFAVGPYV